MRHDQAVAYAAALPACQVGRDERNADRCAVLVDDRWCWTEPQLFTALDERARRRHETAQSRDPEPSHV